MNFQILRVDLPDAEGHHTFITYTLKTILRPRRGSKKHKNCRNYERTIPRGLEPA